MLSTVDNPYDPYSNFSRWFIYDTLHGYNSCGRLANEYRGSDAMTDTEADAEIEKAIDSVIRLDFMNIYVKLRRPKAAEHD